MQLIDEIKEKLGALNPIRLEIQDDSALHAGHKGNGGGGHFNLTIQSSHFNGLSLIARHREIYKLLDQYMPEKIHALSIHAIASDE
jgi:BolA family transcriptional regulator, general stress-responsive regulator